MKVIQYFYTLMPQYQDMVSKNHMRVEAAEGLCANPIKMIHATCPKALTASNNLTAD